jgi:hypothetical protein
MINLLLLGSLYGFKFVSKSLVSWAKLDSLLDISNRPFKVLGRFFCLSTEGISFRIFLFNVESFSGFINGSLVIPELVRRHSCVQ